MRYRKHSEQYRERLFREFVLQLGLSEVLSALLLTAFTESGQYSLLTWSFALMNGGAWLVFRQTGSLRIASHLLIAPLFGLSCIGMVLTGGLEGLTPSMFVTTPMLALMLQGIRQAVFWFVMVIVWVGVLMAWDASVGLEPAVLDPVTIRYVDWGICLTIVFTALYLSWGYEKMRLDIEADLGRSYKGMVDVLTELGAAAEQMRRGAHELRGDAGDQGVLARMEQAATAGRRAISSNSEGLLDMVAKVDAISTIVERFRENAESAVDLLTSIQRISSRLDVMALNMGLEAAKAGDAGAPFSVLADEMRRLAEQVNADSADIVTTFGEIEQRSREAAELAVETSRAGDRGADNVAALSQTFTQVCGLVEEAAKVGSDFSGAALGHLNALEDGIRATIESPA